MSLEQIGARLVLGVVIGCLAGPVAWAQALDVTRALQRVQGHTSGGASGTGTTSGDMRYASVGAADAAAGLKEALRVGTERVVGQLGRADGFNTDSKIHIPLPDSLHKAQSALKLIGASGLADDLELRLNRAAEAATPKAKAIFWDALSNLTLRDAQGILNGPQDAATQYFRTNMSGPLANAMRPVVDGSLAEVGALQSYDAMAGKAKAAGLAPDAKGELSSYVLKRALDGIFLYLAQEEADIRNNPAKRSTDLLRKVFGG